MLLNSEKKVLVFGTGSYAKDIYPTIQKMGMDIIGFVDNDITKQKRKLFGIKIISPEKISEVFNYIVIASTFYIDIHSQLTKKLSVPERKILFSCKSTKSIELWNPPSGMICESNAVFTSLQKELTQHLSHSI